RRVDALQLRDPRRPRARGDPHGRGPPLGRRLPRGVAAPLGPRGAGDRPRRGRGRRRLPPRARDAAGTAGLSERVDRLAEMVAGEVAAMAEAARVVDEVYEGLCERGFAGRSEGEVALAAEVRMRELGAQGPAFPPIVAAGENAALPHHEPSEREIRGGELLLI